MDYELRRQLLGELQSGMDAEAIMRRMDEGLPKLLILHKALTLGERDPEWLGVYRVFPD